MRHVLASGGSQSAARLAAYVNGIQPVAPIFDRVLATGVPNSPCAVNAASAPAELKQTGGANFVHLLEWYTHLLRDDLDTPIIVLNSEAEASECHPNTQPDTDLLRSWEVAGTGHTGLMATEDLEAMARSWAPAATRSRSRRRSAPRSARSSAGSKVDRRRRISRAS